jgi:hypothetical protein
MKMRKALLIVAAFAAGTSVYADKVTFEQAPPAVQQAIRQRSGQHAIEDIDRNVNNGQTTYEASWKDNKGAQQELLLSDQGHILRDVPGGRRGGRGWAGAAPVTLNNGTVAGFTNAQTAPLNWASESLQTKIKGMANGASVDNFQKGQYQGKTAYQASFQTNNTTATVVLDENGTVLASTLPNSAAPTGVITVRPGGRRGSIAGFSNGQTAPMNWASDTVQNKFKQISNGAEIQNFQKGQYNGQTAFLGTYTQNGQPTTIVVNENGTVMTSVPTAVGAAPGTQSGSSSSR